MVVFCYLRFGADLGFAPNLKKRGVQRIQKAKVPRRIMMQNGKVNSIAAALWMPFAYVTIPACTNVIPS
jgi:hypothetical protein